jgi:DNA-binding response OmpR family regulator
MSLEQLSYRPDYSYRVAPDVLVVDNNPSMVKTIEALLKRENYFIYVFRSSRAALLFIHYQTRVNQIVHDLDLSYADCILLLKRAHTKFIWERTAAFISSNNATEEVIVECLQLIVHDYLRNRLLTSQLVARVNRFITTAV